MELGITSEFPLSVGFDKIEETVVAELKKVGFGILTEIDVKATMKKKLDIDYKPYKILGACNPKFANEALTADAEIGLLLPCNVIIYEKADKIIVSIINPNSMFGIISEKVDQGFVAKVEEKLREADLAIKSALN